eukprot:scaffold57534_cov63-Phaeocystis_antarctica.AAC.2
MHASHATNASPHGPFFMKRQKPHSGLALVAVSRSPPGSPGSMSTTLTMRSLPGLPSSPRHSVAPVGRRMLDGSESSSRVISTTPAVSSSRQMPSTSSAT